MLELPFASFANRFSGQPGWVVGRGPTRFQYETLATVEGPVFFINDAVSQEKWLKADQPAFYFAHDGVMECWLSQAGLRPIPVLIIDQPVTGPSEDRRKGLISGADDLRLAKLSRAVLYRRHGPWEQASILTRRREDIGQSGQLHVSSGTIHPLLHFAWYTGCSELHLVGCDGLPGVGYDGRLENRSQSKSQGAMTIRVHQEEMLRQLGLRHDYLGTPPHRLAMTMEITVSRAGHRRLTSWADGLVALFRSGGCAELTTHDFVERSQSYWIKGVWPDIGACVECLLAPSYREMMPSPLGSLLGDPHAGSRVAYLALL